MRQKDPEKDAGHGGFAQTELELDGIRAEGLAKFTLDVETHRGVVSTAGKEHQGCHEPPVGVRTEEQPRAVALLQPKDFAGVGGQLLCTDMKELIPGICLHDGEELLAVMRAWRVAKCSQDVLHGVADDGNVQSGVRCGAGREETHKDVLTTLAGSAVRDDADLVQIGAAKDRGALGGLGEREDSGFRRDGVSGPGNDCETSDFRISKASVFFV